MPQQMRPQVPVQQSAQSVHPLTGQMPPLTEKDLFYAKDAFNWELTAAKKAFQYAHQTLEPECRQVMFQLAQVHQQNCQQIKQHLDQHVQQTVRSNISGGQPVASTIQM